MLLKLLLLNIGILFHSRHSFDIETTWRRLQDMSWRCPRHVFSGTIFRLARRLEDVLKMPWRHLEDISQGVLQDENLLCWRRLQDVLKTYLKDVLKAWFEDIFKKSWRKTKCFRRISVSNKSKPVSNKSKSHKSISDKSMANLKH